MSGYKAVIVLIALVLGSQFIFAQQYAPDPAASAIKFAIKNVGITFNGSFSGLEGEITFDPANPSKSTFNVHVESKTIDTDNNLRDGHLRKEEYFDVEKYPTLSFVSESVAASGKNYTITGKLTIKNVTKTVSFKFTATPQGEEYVFKGGFDLNRRDYGVGGSSISLSDNVKVDLTITAKKKG